MYGMYIDGISIIYLGQLSLQTAKKSFYSFANKLTFMHTNHKGHIKDTREDL